MSRSSESVKKFVLLLFGLAIFTLLLSTTSTSQQFLNLFVVNAASCSETDQGFDLSFPGEIHGVFFGGSGNSSWQYNATFKDTCVSNVTLAEGICGSSIHSQYSNLAGVAHVDCRRNDFAYSRACVYVWDSTPYVGQKVTIFAEVNDTNGSIANGSSTVFVVANRTLGGGGGGGYMDGKVLQLQLTQPRSGNVSGNVSISVSSRGPAPINPLYLTFGTNRSAGKLKVPETNCVVGYGQTGSCSLGRCF